MADGRTFSGRTSVTTAMRRLLGILRIENLHATIDGKAILSGSSLALNPGEVHAIKGAKGSGTSTLG